MSLTVNVIGTLTGRHVSVSVQGCRPSEPVNELLSNCSLGFDGLVPSRAVVEVPLLKSFADISLLPRFVVDLPILHPEVVIALEDGLRPILEFGAHGPVTVRPDLTGILAWPPVRVQ